ncbi:hypothetical protein [Helicobacter sp. 10-6591]|uniref:hypothetical protein n=1 Tax=Helicobacter sp. 10-6591 TaxID=2004998 RepID=UPI000DCAF6C2|nr:hypothetical protein [Helicobacter sp. 10-6591]RAX54787.1 hypothetical protein CCY97_05280 [Helicobacter sp. 10-6591]
MAFILFCIGCNSSHTQDLKRDLALQEKDSPAQIQYLKNLNATDFDIPRKLKLTHRIIPVSISGSTNLNDYSPIVFTYPSQEVLWRD